jgi:hypothetical protein
VLRRPERCSIRLVLLAAAWLGVALSAAASDPPGEVLLDRCRLGCRSEATPADVCAARCPCVAQGFQLGLSPEELPRRVAALDSTGPEAKESRARWDAALEACRAQETLGGY